MVLVIVIAAVGYFALKRFKKRRERNAGLNGDERSVHLDMKQCSGEQGNAEQ